MNNEKLIEKLQGIALRLLYGLVRHVWLINVAFLLGAAFWIYGLFSQSYYRLLPDFKFMRESISKISYVRLDQELFDQVYQAYQDKRNKATAIPHNLLSPF